MKVLGRSLLALGVAALVATPARATKCSQDAVQVGSVCVDKYEASVWEIGPDRTTAIEDVQKGKIKSAADLSDFPQRGVTADDYGAGCPDTANGCKNFYAVSVPGVTPSATLTWFQAAAACRNAGKRLPTNAEWTAAAMGTPDPGTDDGTADCNINATAAVVNTGSRNLCVSNTGAFDMVGNVSEWVADWDDVGNTSRIWAPPFGNDLSRFGGDGSINLPGALFRGGDADDAVVAGVFEVEGDQTPASFSFLRGFRCARGLRRAPPPKPPQPDRKCRQDAVRVGPLCVDKYEASVWEIAPGLPGVIHSVQVGAVEDVKQLEGRAVRHGAQVDDYGANCPDTGNGCKNFYAVSVPGVTPSATLTWFQAATACRNAGKRLLTNAEWQMAALGTPDPGTDNGTTNCNISAAATVVNTGARTLCVSDTGAFDMLAIGPRGQVDASVAPPVQEGSPMKKPEISFRHFAGSGPLSIYWHSGPYGDAVEARKGSGVGWFAPNGEVLGVEFDDVAYDSDEQTLELGNGVLVTVTVAKGGVRVRLDSKRRKTRAA